MVSAAYDLNSLHTNQEVLDVTMDTIRKYYPLRATPSWCTDWSSG